ncbi:tumor necrosis factor ligand superfamily member 4 [Erinaceus europaeus]|uniref:Tumor necrosis factor ligand superfamily member 4 n=1 Tax=Erinaceus europaeus TaxID=9365 RepID=A0A0U5J8Z3_ERIEU|nr:tumor necrosis factor ligand superfamily member 4 [Erinaceus europaeus]CTQ86263.1 TPA: tumor necrosis factor ligand 2B [Erinaceus europaeus]
MEGAQLQDGNVGHTGGWRLLKNKLLLVALLIQGLGLLLCLTYICLHFHTSQVPLQSSLVQSIRAGFTRCEDEKGFILTSLDNDTTMKIENNTVTIDCDGFYLISLKGYFSETIHLTLFYRKNQQPLFSQNITKIVNFVTVIRMAYKDKVYLKMTSPNISCKDIQVNGGELILIHQSPGSFCAN